ncbi:hypothetical protein D3C71_1682390 [compost metagenome]
MYCHYFDCYYESCSANTSAAALRKEGFLVWGFIGRRTHAFNGLSDLFSGETNETGRVNRVDQNESGKMGDACRSIDLYIDLFYTC